MYNYNLILGVDNFSPYNNPPQLASDKLKNKKFFLFIHSLLCTIFNLDHSIEL